MPESDPRVTGELDGIPVERNGRLRPTEANPLALADVTLARERASRETH